MKYQVFWCGRWRPVTNLFQGRHEVVDPLRASSVVLYIAEGPGYAAVEVTPGQIMLMPEEARPSRKLWIPLPDEVPGSRMAPPEPSPGH